MLCAAEKTYPRVSSVVNCLVGTFVQLGWNPVLGHAWSSTLLPRKKEIK